MALIYGATPRKIQKSWNLELMGEHHWTVILLDTFGYLLGVMWPIDWDEPGSNILRIITSVSHGVTDQRRLLPRWIVLVHTDSVLTAQKHALDSRRTIWSFLTTTESVHCQVWLSQGATIGDLLIYPSCLFLVVSLSLAPSLPFSAFMYNLKSCVFNLICFSRLIFRMFFSGEKSHLGVPSTSASIPCKVGFAVSWLIKSKNTRPGKQTVCNWSHGPVEIVSFPSYIAWWIFPVRYVTVYQAG